MLDPWLDQPASQHVRSWLGPLGTRSFPPAGRICGFALQILTYTDSRVSCDLPCRPTVLPERERDRTRAVATEGQCLRSVRRATSPSRPPGRFPQPCTLDPTPARRPVDLLSARCAGRSQMPGCLPCPSHATWLRDPELLPGHLTKTLSAITKVLTDESVLTFNQVLLKASLYSAKRVCDT